MMWFWGSPIVGNRQRSCSLVFGSHRSQWDQPCWPWEVLQTNGQMELEVRLGVSVDIQKMTTAKTVHKWLNPFFFPCSMMKLTGVLARTFTITAHVRLHPSEPRSLEAFPRQKLSTGGPAMLKRSLADSQVPLVIGVTLGFELWPWVAQSTIFKYVSVIRIGVKPWQKC